MVRVVRSSRCGAAGVGASLCLLVGVLGGCEQAPPPQAPAGASGGSAAAAPPASVASPGSSPAPVALEHIAAPVVERGVASAWSRRSPQELGGVFIASAWTGSELVLLTSEREVVATQEGASWEVRSRLPAEPAALASVQGSPGQLVAGLADLSVLLSEDGGRTWRTLRPPSVEASRADPAMLRSRSVLTAVAARRVGAALWVLVGDVNGRASVTRDGGATWDEGSVGGEGAILDASVAPDGAMLACGSRGTIAWRAPEAAGWKGLKTPDKSPWSACAWTEGPGGRGVVIVGRDGLVGARTLEGSWWISAPQEGVHFTDVVALDATGKTLLGSTDRGELRLSRDSGRRWEVIAALGGGGVRGLVASSGGGVFAVGDHLLARSKTGRGGFALLRGAALSALVDLSSPRAGFALAVGERGGLVRVEEGSVEHAPRIEGIGDVTGVDFGSGRFGWASTSSGRVLRTEDGGRSWVAAGALEEARALRGVLALDALNVVAFGQLGGAWMSGDQGRSWERLKLPGASAAAPTLEVDVEAAARLGDGRVVLAADQGTLVESRDGVREWKAARINGLATLVDVAAVGERTWVLDNTGALLRREGDAIALLGVPAEWSFVRVVPGRGGQLLALTAGGLLARSEDGGQRWVVVLSDDDRVINDIVALPDGSFVSVGHGGTTRVSRDGGRTWRAGEGSMGRTLMAVAAQGDALLAVGFNGARLKSRDGGATWEPWSDAAVDAELKRAHLTAIEAEGDRLVLGGVGELWIREAAGRWVHATAADPATPLGELRRLVLLEGGQVVALTSNGGLWRLAADRLVPLPLRGVEDARVSDLVHLGGGRLAISTGSGLVTAAGVPAVGQAAGGALEVTRVPAEQRSTQAPWLSLSVAPGWLWLGGPGGLWAAGVSAAGVESPRQIIPAFPQRCHDVDFITSDEGFAGCDEGVVLHTRDGGRSWAAEWTGSWGRIEALRVRPEVELWAVTREGSVLRRPWRSGPSSGR